MGDPGSGYSTGPISQFSSAVLVCFLQRGVYPTDVRGMRETLKVRVMLLQQQTGSFQGRRCGKLELSFLSLLLSFHLIFPLIFPFFPPLTCLLPHSHPLCLRSSQGHLLFFVISFPLSATLAHHHFSDASQPPTTLFSFSPPYHVSRPLFLPPTVPPWRVPLSLSAQPIVACEKKKKI